MKHLILFLFLIFSIGCTKKEIEIEKQLDALQGAWELYNYSEGFANNENYEGGQINFIFDGQNNLSVYFSINLPPESVLPVQSSGNYIYTIDNQSITVFNNIYSFHISEDNILTLENGCASDGPCLKFRKIEI